MLNNLYIKNFALFEQISVDFEQGLNIISGETGSGKSVLINAIALLKGSRVNKSMIGKFDKESIITASFTSNEIVDKILLDNDINLDENIIISRKFTENSSIIKLNNKPINLSLLTLISDNLFDIHGQHSQLIVLNKSNYIEILDEFIDESIELKGKLKSNLKNIKVLQNKLDDIDLDEDQVLREIDILNFQINEIEEFDFKNFDEEELSKEHKKLSNQTEILDGLSFVNNIFTDGYQRKSLKDYINEIYSKLTDISLFDNNIEEFLSRITDIREAINDLSRDIDSYYYSQNLDEERLVKIEEIFSTLQNLKRKYGRDINDILNFLNESKNKIKVLRNIEKIRLEYNNSILDLEKENQKISENLSNYRKEIAKVLEKSMINELNEMNMKNLQFKISFERNTQINDSGFDIVDFLISTNKGQDLKSLNTVASGGEVSRFMLALKAVLADKEQVGSIVFDEIDTGISGKTADIVGNKLKKIADKRQLLVITHLPQIAAKANSHYLIEKQSNDTMTVSNVYKLDNKEKVMEVARLISGSNITDLSIKSAEELIESN